MNTKKVKSVLIVEDDTDILFVLEGYLKQMGFFVFRASDGVEALNLLKSIEMPQLILLDLRMPNMSGAEFVSRFVSQYTHSRAPFILMSAAPDVKKRAHELGAADFLAKPFDFKELIKKVNTHIN